MAYGFGGGATERRLAGEADGFGAFATRGTGAGAGAGASTIMSDGCTTDVVVVSDVGSSEGSGSTTGGGAAAIVAVAFVVFVVGASSLVPAMIASAVPRTTAAPTAIIDTRAARLAFGATNVDDVLTLGPEPRATGMSCAV